jgi:CDP-2,3-bis-(O-geranylgeranyl)-sn-glycerol synthase
MNTLLEALYFIAPAGLANMLPLFAKALNFPGGEPVNAELFGAHKTWRGILAGALGGIAGVMLQAWLYEKKFFYSLSLLNYRNFNVVTLGLIFGLGALGGDLVKSYFKRRLKIIPGKPWFPFDQLDFVAGTLLLFYIFYPDYFPELRIIFALAILMPLANLFANTIAYKLRIKNVWW